MNLIYSRNAKPKNEAYNYSQRLEPINWKNKKNGITFSIFSRLKNNNTNPNTNQLFFFDSILSIFVVVVVASIVRLVCALFVQRWLLLIPNLNRYYVFGCATLSCSNEICGEACQDRINRPTTGIVLFALQCILVSVHINK